SRDSCAELQGFGPQKRSMSIRSNSSLGWARRSLIADRMIPECFMKVVQVWDSVSAGSPLLIFPLKAISQWPHPQAATSSSSTAKSITLKRSGPHWEHKHGEAIPILR